MAAKTQKKETAMEKQKRLHVEILRQMLTLATAGFGLVAALAWNGLIQEIVNSYIKKHLPAGSGILSLLIYAVIVTVIAVFVTLQLSKAIKRLENK